MPLATACLPVGFSTYVTPFHMPCLDPTCVQIVLPPSAEHDLLSQDAGPRNGALLFELQSRGRTHAGLLSFSAAEGTIGIPPAVAENIWGPGSVPSGQDVKVTYRKLARGRHSRSRL